MCLCGGLICAPSLAASAPYVEAHNATALHRSWRVITAARAVSLPLEVQTLTVERDRSLEAELVMRHPDTYRDPRRQRPTAGTATRDVSGSTTDSSAPGVGDAA